MMLTNPITKLFLLFLVPYGCITAKAGVSRFGVLAGANIGNISSTPDDGFSSKTGIILGGFYEVLVSPFLGLSSEFLAVGKGGKRGTDEVSLKITYFEVPLLLKVHLGVKRFGLFLFGGPSLGFVISSSGEAADGSELVLSNLYPNEMGVQIGAGAELPVTKNAGLLFSLRYSLGLSDISQAANNYKNTGIYFLAGVTFRLEEEEQYTDTESRAKEYLKKRYSNESHEAPRLLEDSTPENPVQTLDR